MCRGCSEAAVGDCSVKLQREADRNGPSMRKPTARPEAAARQTACDRLSLCVWVRAGAGRLWRKVKNVDSLLSARNLQEEEDNSILREFELLFELLESCAKDEHLIKSGVTAMDASSQVTLDTRMFGVEEDQDLR